MQHIVLLKELSPGIINMTRLREIKLKQHVEMLICSLYEETKSLKKLTIIPII